MGADFDDEVEGAFVEAGPATRAFRRRQCFAAKLRGSSANSPPSVLRSLVGGERIRIELQRVEHVRGDGSECSEPMFDPLDETLHDGPPALGCRALEPALDPGLAAI